MHSRVLAINGGSSTIKFAAFRANASERILSGKVDRIGDSNTVLSASDAARAQTQTVVIAGSNYREAARALMDWIEDWSGRAPFAAIGHRVVHGGARLDQHQRATADLMSELRRVQPLDPTHLPGEIALLELCWERFPDVPQIVCFDTAFHRRLPRVAQMLPIPRRYFESGIRRFGFHGLSYMYLLEELRRIAGAAADGRVIFAHLGAGASMAAVAGGSPVDTSMAFTPNSGFMMGTRCGDLDPGVLVHLSRTEPLTPDQMDDLVSHRSGLAGVSGTTSDMRELISRRAHDPRAQEAFDLFCYAIKKQIGAYAAALGGLETLVFSGGIGEHSPEVRAAVCGGLEFLGLRVDPSLNAQVNGAAAVISRSDSHVAVHVIPTDEERMIARIAFALTAKKD
jgi:acetate kinase